MAISAEDMDLRLTQEMARCAAEWDQAHEELRAHHKAMDDEDRDIETKIVPHREAAEALVHGDAPLDKKHAVSALKFIDHLARRRKVRQARRIAYNATDGREKRIEEPAQDAN